MNGPANDVPPRPCTWLERNFLTLAIMATSACASAVIVDAARRDDVPRIGSGDDARFGILDGERQAPAVRPAPDGARTRTSASTSCGRTTATRAGSEPETL
jgi:hypothetical protein